jgi:hypothetical protein
MGKIKQYQWVKASKVEALKIRIRESNSPDELFDPEKFTELV